MRQRRPADALRAEHVDIIELGELIGRESLARSPDHASRIVDEDVEPTVLGQDFFDRRRCRGVGLHIELKGAQVYRLRPRIGGDRLDLSGVSAVETAHRRVGDMPRASQSVGDQAPEPA